MAAQAQVTVTVNGKSVEQYLGQAKSVEIQKHLREELRLLGKMSRGRN